MHTHKTLIVLTTLLTATWAPAATFCVSTAQMLELVLDITEDNGQDDHIKIKSGNYIPLNNYGFRFLLAENHDLEISGSWNTDCSAQSLNPLDTVLDGDDSKRVISFFSNQNSPTYTSNIRLSMMSINNGFYEEQLFLNSKAAGLAFEVTANHGNHFLLEHLFFMGNRSNLASAFRAEGRKVTVRNSIFFQNESDIGTVSALSEQFYFINNTVVSNTYYDQFNGGLSDAGLLVSSFTDQAYVANNILRDNYGPDVVLHSATTNYLYNNNYQGLEGTADFSGNNMSADPQLVFFAPPITSPVVDKGRSEPSGIIPFPTPFHQGWRHGDFDFLGADRVVNNQVDIGAIEALPEVPLFKNGFEQTRGG